LPAPVGIWNYCLLDVVWVLSSYLIHKPLVQVTRLSESSKVKHIAKNIHQE
jgi:hypothetical protein